MKGEWLRENGSNVVIIFVHGILSDAYGAWTNKNGTFWPSLIESERGLEIVDIYCIDYYTSALSGSYSISDASTAVYALISSEGILQADKIIFCCHSMGGIIARQFLLDHQLYFAEQKKQIGLFLVASPSLGSVWADWVNFFLKAPRFFGILKHSQGESLKYISTNDYLFHLNNRFRKLVSSGDVNIMGQELLETKAIFNLDFGLIVSLNSASLNFPNAIKVPKSTHSSISKPSDSNAFQHVVFRDFINTVLKWDLNPIPTIRKTIYQQSAFPGRFKFDYKFELTAFIGRSGELDLLLSFIDSSFDFSWWLMTGRGGVGKSRIALELINRLSERGDYDALFVQYVDLQRYLMGTKGIDHPTVIIVDYAARFADQIFELIKYYSVQTQTKHKVRILLIEREADGEWWKRFQTSVEVKSTVFGEEPLSLQGLLGTDLIEITKAVISSYNADLTYPDERIEGLLAAVDPFRRPLYAIFVGVALSDGQSISAWNEDKLLKYQLDREARVISEKYSSLVTPVVISEHKKLLVLATIAGGIASEMLTDLVQRNIPWLPSESTFNLDLYLELSGAAHSDDFEGIPPLLPDILGEFFVLEAFDAPASTPLNRSWISQISEYAREVGYPPFFTRRALQDFPRHHNIPLLLNNDIFAGYNANFLLRLIKEVFYKEFDTCMTLRGHIKKLSDEWNEDEKIFMDHPARAFQEASAFMVQISDGQLGRQLGLYQDIKVATDSFIEHPQEFMVDQPDDRGLSDMTYEEAKEQFRLLENEEFRENFVKNHLVVWADIPFWECRAILDIAKATEVQERQELYTQLISRLELIDTQFTDPRINELVFVFYRKYSKLSFEEMDDRIRKLFLKTKATPKQVPPIDVSTSKATLMEDVCNYYLKDRNDHLKSMEYFTEMFNHLLGLTPHSMHVPGIELLAYTAGNIIEYYLSISDRAFCDWYFQRIVDIKNSLGWAASPIIGIMASQLHEKLKNVQS